MVLVCKREIELAECTWAFIKPHHNFTNNYFFLCIKCLSVYEIRYESHCYPFIEIVLEK